MSRGAPSVWWPTPTPASRWFTETERSDAHRYHRPIERAGLLRVCMQMVLLIGAGALADGRSAEVGVALVLVALTGPRLAVDLWHEFVHEPRFGRAPVRPGAFALTSLGRGLIEAVALVLAQVAVVSVARGQMPIALPVVAAMAVPLLSFVVGPPIALALHRARPVPDDHPARSRLGRLADLSGLGSLRLALLDPESFDGVNAFTTGGRRRATVAVSGELLDGPPVLFDHVVGHELAQVRRRHLEWATLGSSVSAGSVTAIALQLGLGWFEGAARLAGVIAMAIVVSVPFRLFLAWWSRAHERQADRDALGAVSVPPSLLKQLYLADRAQLEPSRYAQAFNAHPAPPERLEWVDRLAERA